MDLCGLTTGTTSRSYHDRDFRARFPFDPRSPAGRRSRDSDPHQVRSRSPGIQDPTDTRNPSHSLNERHHSRPQRQSARIPLCRRCPARVLGGRAAGHPRRHLHDWPLDDVFAFATLRVDYYKNGPGKTDRGAMLLWRNAARVLFNIAPDRPALARRHQDARRVRHPRWPARILAARLARPHALTPELPSAAGSTSIPVPADLRRSGCSATSSTCPTVSAGRGRTFCDDAPTPSCSTSPSVSR